MKKLIIPVPEGYTAIQLEVPDEIAHLIRPKAIKSFSNGGDIEIIYFDEALSALS